MADHPREAVEGEVHLSSSQRLLDRDGSRGDSLPATQDQLRNGQLKADAGGLTEGVVIVPSLDRVFPPTRCR